jgi:hypothetical protein
VPRRRDSSFSPLILDYMVSETVTRAAPAFDVPATADRHHIPVSEQPIDLPTGALLMTPGCLKAFTKPSVACHHLAARIPWQRAKVPGGGSGEWLCLMPKTLRWKSHVASLATLDNSFDDS